MVVTEDGWINSISEGLFDFIAKSSLCDNLKLELLLATNIKIFFPNLLEHLEKFDTLTSSSNISKFMMEIPRKMNEFIMEFLQEKSSLENINALMHYDNIY